MSRLPCCIAALFPLAFFAQWTGQPASPLPLSTVSSAQTLLVSIPDGDGGWYAFWRDARNENRGEVWGQRLTATGEYLWEPEGRLVFAVPGRSLRDFHVDGNTAQGFLIAASRLVNANSADTVLVMRVDADAAPQWSAPVAIGGFAPGMPANYVCRDPRVVLHGNGSAHVAWTHLPGTTESIAVNVIEVDGTLPEGFNGQDVEGGSGSVKQLHSDDAGGVFLVWRATIGTTPVRVRRYGANLNSPWASLMQFPQGGGSGSDFDALPDGDGGLYLTYRVGGVNDIFLTRLNASGAQPWSPAVQPVVEVDGVQQRPSIDRRNDHVYIAWEDGRPGTAGIHVQKFTTAGTALWTANGERMLGSTSNSAHPRVTGLPDGGAMVLFSSPAYAGGRVASDGTMVWSSAASLASTSPSAGFHVVHATPINGAVAFWQSGSSRMLAAEVLPDGSLSGPTSIQEVDGVQRLDAWPVPANHELFVRLPEGLSDLRYTLHGSDGRQLQGIAFNATGELLRLDVSGLAAGWYVLRAVGGNATYQVRFVKQ